MKAQTFDRSLIAGRGLKYERLDQLTVEVLLGVRKIIGSRVRYDMPKHGLRDP